MVIFAASFVAALAILVAIRPPFKPPSRKLEVSLAQTLLWPPLLAMIVSGYISGIVSLLQKAAAPPPRVRIFCSMEQWAQRAHPLVPDSLPYRDMCTAPEGRCARGSCRDVGVLSLPTELSIQYGIPTDDGAG